MVDGPGRIGTHRWQQWSLAQLLEAKAATGLGVSLVVPARNEAATVGDVVTRVRSALVETVALLDEVVAWATERAPTMVLHCAEDNRRARDFYVRNGFAATGRTHPNEVHPDIIELEMARPLRGA